jgi:hypothetical protein
VSHQRACIWKDGDHAAGCLRCSRCQAEACGHGSFARQFAATHPDLLTGGGAINTFFAQTENDTVRPGSLEALVKLYVPAPYPNQKHPRIAEVLIYFLELRRVLILIDGLNEAAGNRHLFERMMDHTAGANNVSLMVSTRDYEFKTSRMQARFGGFEKLSGFEAFTIRPLDEQRRDELIE